MATKLYATDGSVTFAGYSQSWVWHLGRKGYQVSMGSLNRDGDPVHDADVPQCLLDELERLAIEAATEGNPITKMREAIVAGTDMLGELATLYATTEAQSFDEHERAVLKAAVDRNHQMADALAAIAGAVKP